MMFPDVNTMARYDGGDADGFHFSNTDPAGADMLIRDRGTPVLYWKGMVCPCVRVQTGRSRGVCPVCGGHGYGYPPDMRVESWAITPGRRDSKAETPAGPIPGGSVRMTFVSDITPQIGDLVFPARQVHMVDEVIQRDKEEVSRSALRDLRDSDLEDASGQIVRVDRVRYPRIVGVESIRGWNASAGKSVLDKYGAERHNDLKDGQLAEFYAAAMPVLRSWRVTGNQILWDVDPGPVYTIKYRAEAVYYIAEPAAFRNDGDKALPYAPVLTVRYDAVGQDEASRL